VVRHSLVLKQQREDHRFAEQMALDVSMEEGGERILIPAITTDLNPAGLGFRSTRRIEPETAISMALPLSSGTITVNGVVRHVAKDKSTLGEIFMHGVLFDAMPMGTKDAIELHCTHHAMPMWRLQYRQSIDIMTRASEVVRNLRGDKRRLVGLPARVRVRGADGTSVGELPGRVILDEMSTNGARLISSAPIAPGTSIEFDVPGTLIKSGGTVRHVRALETPARALFSMGIALDSPRTKRRGVFAFRRSRNDEAQFTETSLPSAAHARG
jgi:hypothetical protein